MIATREGEADGRGSIHEVAAATEVLLGQARRADAPFLVYLLELALGEAAAVAAKVRADGMPCPEPAGFAAMAADSLRIPPMCRMM